MIKLKLFFLGVGGMQCIQIVENCIWYFLAAPVTILIFLETVLVVLNKPLLVVYSKNNKLSWFIIIIIFMETVLVALNYLQDDG